MTGKRVTIATYDNVPVSEVARLRLEDAGIPVHVENTALVSTLWHVVSALDGVRLIVDEDHAEAARALIADIRNSPLLAPHVDDAQSQQTCLACGAVLPSDADRCTACGWSYSDGDEAERRDAANGDVAPADTSAVRPGAPPKENFEHIRNVGRPFVSLWVAFVIAGVLIGFLSCVLTLLDDLFQ